MGIDTSTEVCALGLLKENKALGEINIELKRRHSERLLPNINTLLNETGYKLKDLDGIAVTIGPGSFTGLRIGLSTVKTFIQVLDIPVIGVSTLEVLAYSLHHQKDWIVPIINAKSERVYTAIFKGGEKDMQKSRLSEDRTLSLDNLFDELKEMNENEDFFFIGNAVEIYKKQLINSTLNIILAPSYLNQTRGIILAELGNYYFEKGLKDEPLDLLPRYLKRPQAEINWLRKKFNRFN